MSELIESLNSFQHRSPKLYLGMVTASALAGIAILLLLPILSLNFFISSIATLFSLKSATELAALLYQLPLSALFAYLAYQFIILPLDIPKASEIYISVNKKKTPRLLALIQELEDHFKVNSIHNILLNDQYDISVHVSPMYSIPHLGETTLQIGLPLMQTVSADQFKALLARRIGQLSLAKNRVTGRINLYRDMLNQYLTACQQSSHWSYKPFFYFIRHYQTLFNQLSFYAIRMDELQQDQYAIEIIDEESFSKTLSQTLIASHYLKNTFWVAMYKLQRQYPNKKIFPHTNMAPSFTQSINMDDSRTLLNQLFQNLFDFVSPTPLLRSRLFEIGYEGYSLPDPLDITAATVYLDTALPKITNIFDKLWLQRIQVQREAPALVNSSEQRLNTLSNKILDQPLSAAETWELAVLTEKLKGYHLAIPIYKKILERNPMHAKSMFAIGRILLSYNDSTGITALDKAIFLEPAMKKSADELIVRYHSRIENSTKKQSKLTA